MFGNRGSGNVYYYGVILKVLMCGRYSFFETEQLYERFDVEDKVLLNPRYNVAPSQVMPVIVEKKKRQIVPMHWGLMPSWAKNEDEATKMINARVETVAEKPSFRDLLKTQRCLIPANGFFEWDKKDKKRIPYYVHLKKEPLFGFAGLYNRWTDKETGETLDTYTILTTNAENEVKTIHTRMPIILTRQSEEHWLDFAEENSATLVDLLRTHHEQHFKMYPISELVNSPRNDTKNIFDKDWQKPVIHSLF